MTAKQRDVYRFMLDYQDEFGAPPTLREIAAAIGVHVSTAHSHVKALVRHGHAEPRQVAREIVETRYFPLELAEAA